MTNSRIPVVPVDVVGSDIYFIGDLRYVEVGTRHNLLPCRFVDLKVVSEKRYQQSKSQGRGWLGFNIETTEMVAINSKNKLLRI